MKTFESLFAELSEKAATKQAGSLTVDELAKGTHFIGKSGNISLREILLQKWTYSGLKKCLCVLVCTEKVGMSRH